MILVHGAWSSPADWRWVEEPLVERGLDVVALDLVSHRDATATRADDVEQVAAAVAGAPTPPVVVGWSYGGSVLTDLDLTSLRVARLVYVAAVPGLPPGDDHVAPPDAEVDVSHLVFGEDGTVVLDDEWFVGSDPAVATLPAPVVDHLRSHPRRPVPLEALVAPPVRAAWRDADTTVLLGASDELIGDAQRRWTRETILDTRIVDSDHFILMRRPQAIVDTVLEV